MKLSEKQKEVQQIAKLIVARNEAAGSLRDFRKMDTAFISIGWEHVTFDKASPVHAAIDKELVERVQAIDERLAISGIEVDR